MTTGRLLACMLLPVSAIAQHEQSKSAAALEQLSSLVGEWKGVQEGKGEEITLTYRLTGGGTTLMEESKPASGGAMLTTFSADGDHLLATHYCSAGNQPHMASKTIVDPRRKVWRFSLVNVTGMKSPDDWHNTSLEMVLDDSDHLTQNWDYLYKGKTGTTTFHFARGPHPSLRDQAKVFGRFVGTWDVAYHYYGRDGRPTAKASGEVVLGWVMDGHATQDVFIANPMAMHKERSLGTTLRYYEPKSGKWRVIFVLPEFDYVRALSGGAVGDDRIVLYGEDPDGTKLRWSFNDIRPDSFVWRGEKSADGGQTWWMEEQHNFTRRAPTSMIRTLRATGPHPSLGDQAGVFGRFVGTWDVDYGEISEDGRVTHSPGELDVGWVLDGRALQDFFIGYPTAPGEERTIGTTLRYFDNKSGKWRITYVEPPSNTVVQLTGGQEGDRIVLYGEADGIRLRWSFNDITDDSFTWRGEHSRDGGKTWRLVEEHHMKRRTTG